MKRILTFSAMLISAFVAIAQTLNITTGDITYLFPADQTGEMIYSNGTYLTIMEKTFTLTDINHMVVDNTEVADNIVTISYNENNAKVTVAGNVAKYLEVEIKGAHVQVKQSETLTNDLIETGIAEEITYILEGNSNDGEFYLEGSSKSTLKLNGLNLTNATPCYSGAAIGIANGKRIEINVRENTVNSLSDSKDSPLEQKGALYVKGHLKLKGTGTLNLQGNYAHALKTGEYIDIKECSINVTKAIKDGINCNQYFLIENGNVQINGVGDDGIQCDLDGTESTGELTDHKDEDSGNIYLNGGVLNINVTASAAKGFKSKGDIFVCGGDITVTTSAGGTWDEEESKTKASACLDSDGNITLTGGSLNLTATEAGGKGFNIDGNLTATGGKTIIKTSGQAVVASSNGTISVCSQAQSLDRYSTNYKSSPKGIKTDGTITIDDTAIISVTTSGVGGEGIESKHSISINSGQVTVNAYDDAINASYASNSGTGNLTISGGQVYARSTGNDGIDSNGNCYIKGGLVYAIGSNQPEVAVDANSEQQRKLYVQGGTIIAIGGLENGSLLTQACYSTNSWNKNVWYSLTNGDEIIAFKTPNSGGSTLVISASAKPILKSGVTANGTTIFDGTAYLDATVTGGTSVNLSTYSGGNSGGGGRPGRW